MTDDKPGQPIEGEIVAPEQDSSGPPDGSIYQTLFAQIQNYTDRPDLFIEAVERHDPGFIARMNAASEAGAEQMRAARFRFGRFQAYFSVVVSGVAAVAILASVILAVYHGTNFWVLLGLALAYAVTQSGPAGFARLIETVNSVVRRKKQDDEDQE